MEVLILPTAEEVAELASSVIVEAVSSNPRAAIGVATGSTPLATYKKLIAAHRQGEVQLDGIRPFMLDEYLDLSPDHPELYRNVLKRNLLDGVDVVSAELRCPDVFATDLLDACRRYEQLIVEQGGIDVQLLGIGSDGHVGFNEPGSSLGSRTRIKTLHTDTIRDNARFFDSLDEVPRHVITQGLGTIMDARHLLLIAHGATKADAIAAAVEGPLSASCPGSVLQLHPHATVIVDEGAGAALAQQEYYRHAWANKPEWQGL